MAIFGVIVAVLARVRPILNNTIQDLTAILRRLRRITFLIVMMQAWTVIVSALDGLLVALRRGLRRLGMLPFPPLRLVTPALRQAVGALSRLIRPLRSFVRSLKPILKSVRNTVSRAKNSVKAARSTLRSVRNKLLIAEILARILEQQQKFLELLLGEQLQAAVRPILDRIERVADLIDRLNTAMNVLGTALDVLIGALDALIRQLDAFFQRVRALLDLLSPLQAALNALEAGVRRLRQSRLFRWILDGLSWLMDQLDALFEALLRATGLQALLDRLLSRIPGIAQIQAAMNAVLASMKEIEKKLNEVRRKIDEIRDALDQLETALDDLIAFLQSLFYLKVVIEASMLRLTLWPYPIGELMAPDEIPDSLNVDDDSVAEDRQLLEGLTGLDSNLTSVESTIEDMDLTAPAEEDLLRMQTMIDSYLSEPIELPDSDFSSEIMIEEFNNAVDDRLQVISDFLNSFESPELAPEALRELVALEQIAPKDGDLTKTDLIDRD